MVRLTVLLPVLSRAARKAMRSDHLLSGAVTSCNPCTTEPQLVPDHAFGAILAPTPLNAKSRRRP
jgi:hypothetical protein